jgi:hypothetical protein
MWRSENESQTSYARRGTHLEFTLWNLSTRRAI